MPQRRDRWELESRMMKVERRIRLARAADAAEVAAIYEPYVTSSAISFEVEAPTPIEMERRIESVLAIAPWLVCEAAGNVVGYAYASRHRERAAYKWSTDVTVYVRADHHRLGIGRDLYRCLFSLLRIQGFFVAHAGVTLPNEASIGLHESFGFQPVGVYRGVGWKLGTWFDVGWWQLALQPRPDTPSSPLSLGEAQKLSSWPRWISADS